MTDVEIKARFSSGRREEIIARIRAGTVIPPNAAKSLYAAFIAKGDVLTCDEVDDAFAKAVEELEAETISFPLIGGNDD